MQLSRHIGKAAWSTADKALYTLIGLAFILPQKVIGERNWGIFTTAQAILNVTYMLTDGFALQPIVNFGMDAERRSQAYTFSAILHLLFVGTISLLVYLGRFAIADIYHEEQLVSTLALFPLTALGFLLRNYFLKVAQLHLDPRSTFFMDVAWVGSLILLIVYGWLTGWLVTAEDMMVISAIASGVSSLIGVVLYGLSIRLSFTLDIPQIRKMLLFSVTQFLSSATFALQAQGDILLLKRFASSAMVGNYDTAKKIFRGFEALRDAGALLVYPGTAKLHSEGRIPELVLLVEKSIGFMLIVFLPLVLFVWLGPTDYLFEMIYKGKYQAAPDIFKVLTLAALVLPFSMNVYVLNGMGEVRSVFRLTLISAVLFFAVGLVLIPAYGATGAAMTVVASYVWTGIFATMGVRKRIPFSLRAVFGRWRDAADFARRAWRKRMPKK